MQPISSITPFFIWICRKLTLTENLSYVMAAWLHEKVENEKSKVNH